MSEEADLDLSGQWTGFFNYPVAAQPVNFEAVLHDAAGRLTGTTTEPGTTRGSLGRTLHAVIDGHREGRSVSFIKMYDDADGEYDSVRYTGAVAGGGDEIAGSWEIPGIWSGTFLMVRRPAASQSERREAGEEVR